MRPDRTIESQKPKSGRLTVKEMAEMAQVSERLMHMAIRVLRIGIPDLRDLIMNGTLNCNQALTIAELPHEEQHRIVAEIRAGVPPKKAVKAVKAAKLQSDKYAAFVRSWNRLTDDERGRFFAEITRCDA